MMHAEALCCGCAKQTLPTLCSGVKYRDMRKIYYICLTIALQVIGAVSAAGPQKNHLHSRLCMWTWKSPLS